MYLGVVIILQGETVSFWPIGLFCYAITFFIIADLFIRYFDGPMLKRRFGEPYDEYSR